MTNDMLQDLLSAVKNGGLSLAEGMNALRDSAFLDLGHTKFDTHRALRNGFPEVVYGEGKTPEQVEEIFCLSGTQRNILATRVSPEMASHVQPACPDTEYKRLGRTLTLARNPQVLK